MASGASFPIHLNGTDLQFGSVTIPLDTATCFWVGDKIRHRVHVYLHTGEFQTTLRLFLESAENLRACIDAFRQMPKIKPCIFYISSVKPIVSDQTLAKVEFKFMDLVDRDFFAEFARPILGAEWSVEKWAGNDPFTASVTYYAPDTKENQIVKINQMLKRIKYRFVASGINDALRRLKDRDFPPEPIQDHPKPLLLDHIREYSITRDGAVEELDMIADTPVQIPIDMREVEEWILNPQSQLSKEIGQLDRLRLRVQRLLEMQPLNMQEISPLIRAAFSIKGFDIRELFLTDKGRQGRERSFSIKGSS